MQTSVAECMRTWEVLVNLL